MDELAIVRSMVLRVAGGLPASAPLAKAVLEWAQPHAEWLLPDPGDDPGENFSWEALLAGLAERRPVAPSPQALDLADAFAELLALSPVDAALLERVAREERVSPGERFKALLDAAPEAATVLRVAAPAGRLAGETDSGTQATTALVRALRGGEPPLPRPDGFDLDLFETDAAIDRLFASVSSGAADVLLLLTDPPGTGKTAFAHHLARAVDRPLMVKRASDLLSKWVGETAAQIADAFAEAAPCCCSTRLTRCSSIAQPPAPAGRSVKPTSC